MVGESIAATSAGPVRYLESGAGWPVVLLHAFPLNADMWRPVLERVPDGWRYIAPDLRGFGPAAAEGSPARTIDDMALGVRALLDTLEIERATIGGLSMGGYVLFALHRLAPDRFERLVLADTRPQADTPEVLESRRTMLERARRDGPSAIASDMLPKLLGATSHRERPELQRRVREIIESSSREGIAGAIEAMMGRPDSTPDLARIARPVLILVGEEDPVTPPADSEAMQRQLNRSRLVVLQRAGHLSAIEVPDEFSRALADFLASNI